MAAGESPLHQFEINRLLPIEIGGLDVSFTNSSLWMVIAVGAASLMLTMSMSRGALVPGRWQSIAELAYEFIAKLLSDSAGREARKYFPLVFSLFVFILFANLLGLIPYAFTTTSHIIVTFAMAGCVFIGVTILGFVKHGARFLGFFVPHGVPAVMLPLLVPIELISYLIRPITLSVRLFANMLAGHTLLKVLGGFIVALGFFGILPWAFIVALYALELLVAFLQAYVFTILTCLYINDALHMHEH
ncbi:MAG: F0F1 ATP synthase subunit A [Alphaproteobacteria bacterium]|nr:F0F1 ATP synthase subunit A [Alphaproteobacteria bacterium]